MRTGINAPQVRYDSPNNPPNEIASHPNLLKGDNVHYMTIVLQNAHIEPAHKGENSIDLIHTFRTYLHYHIKCSKAYIHQRMRAKSNEFLQILNRAKPDKGKIGGITIN